MDELIIPASYFYLLYLYVFNDFQIGSLQKIHKFIFFIFQIGINNSTSYLSRLFSKFPKICNGVSALR